MADAQLRASMNHTFNVLAPSSRTAAGTPTLGAAVPFKAAWERVNRRAWNGAPDGTAVESVLEHFVCTEQDINPGDVVFLPGDSTADATKGRQAKSVEKFYDNERTTPVLDHVEFYL